MAERSWFFASNGQQQGPVPESQLRDLIARGSVTPDTLVWTEGMAGWQRAAEIPGLMSGASRPPAMPQAGSPPVTAGGAGYGSGALFIDFGIWEFVWRSLLCFIGLLLVIPVPWVLCWYVNWFMSCVRVPGRPNLSFTGAPGTIALWYFGMLLVLIILGVGAYEADVQGIGNLGGIVQFVMGWLFLRYVVANIASNGQPLGLSFSGSFWAYLGYTILGVLAFITIIGWAWVYVAQIRWFCRNIQGTRRDVVFNGTGLEFLWRVLAVMFGFAVAGFIAVTFVSGLSEFLQLIVGFALFLLLSLGALPWVYRWLMRWLVSQTMLVERV